VQDGQEHFFVVKQELGMHVILKQMNALKEERVATEEKLAFGMHNVLHKFVIMGVVLMLLLSVLQINNVLL